MGEKTGLNKVITVKFSEQFLAYRKKYVNARYFITKAGNNLKDEPNAVFPQRKMLRPREAI